MLFEDPAAVEGPAQGDASPGVPGGEGGGAAGLPMQAAGGEQPQAYLRAKEGVSHAEDLGASQGLPDSLGFLCLFFTITSRIFN